MNSSLSESRTPLTKSDHEARALKHESVANKPFKKKEEWSAVCFFYASLHRIQAALIDDPIFQDESRLKAKSSLLTSNSRFASSHSGHFSDGRWSWGMNDLVVTLYRPILDQYMTLYANSIHIRYRQGPKLSLNALSERALDIKIAYQQRKLVA